MPAPRKTFTRDGHVFHQESGKARRWVSPTTSETFSRRAGETIAGTPLKPEGLGGFASGTDVRGLDYLQHGSTNGRPLRSLEPLGRMLRHFQREGVEAVDIAAYAEFTTYPGQGQRWASRLVDVTTAINRLSLGDVAAYFNHFFPSSKGRGNLGVDGPVRAYAVAPAQ